MPSYIYKKYYILNKGQSLEFNLLQENAENEILKILEKKNIKNNIKHRRRKSRNLSFVKIN